MSNKTCSDCLHCSIENESEVYCSGMPWHYPFGGSDAVSLDKEACEHFLERDKPTVFHRITKSPEVLAAKEVLQYVLGIGFKVISEHKGEWSNSEVEHLITDLNQLTMEKFYERGFIARIKDDEK